MVTFPSLISEDITLGSSFTKAKYWVTELLDHEPQCKVYLVGTKRKSLSLLQQSFTLLVDLLQSGKTRDVSEEEVKNYATTIKGCKVWELSALQGTNVNELFHDVAENADWQSKSYENLPLAEPLTSEQSKACC